MGAVAGIVSAASTGAQTGFGFMQHQQEAQAASLRGRFANDVEERNARLAERQGQDALNRGSLEENRMRGETSQQVSASRASLAAQGIDISSGSAAGDVASENLIGDVDALTIRNNAAREAYGFDVEAANHRMNGRLALMAGENEAANQRLQSVSTLLSGASSLYGIYSGTRTGTKIGAGAMSGRSAVPVVRRSGTDTKKP